LCEIVSRALRRALDGENQAKKVTMNCQELADQIEQLRPSASTRDVARLCLLVCNAVEDLDQLDDGEKFHKVWQEMGLKLQAATDQHAAMTEELEGLARTDPQKFSPDQIWILIRAIKVQSQILELYVGETRSRVDS
jgi:hypothetical protein